ncbi:hypothetical protein Syun_003457 [Stephania yunnanensis]|uniref:Uncharacterized protein n=1 Tax=Stephania yunnanensis TaxID=152371 RepID=A0AAP0L3S8_9MAGN
MIGRTCVHYVYGCIAFRFQCIRRLVMELQFPNNIPKALQHFCGLLGKDKNLIYELLDLILVYYFLFLNGNNSLIR